MAAGTGAAPSSCMGGWAGGAPFGGPCPGGGGGCIIGGCWTPPDGDGDPIGGGGGPGCGWGGFTDSGGWNSSARTFSKADKLQ